MRTDSLRTADEQLLGYLAENPPDYVPLIANRLGMHLGYAERRVEALVEAGLVEAVSNESIYTITERGQRALEGERLVRAAADD